MGQFFVVMYVLVLLASLSLRSESSLLSLFESEVWVIACSVLLSVTLTHSTRRRLSAVNLLGWTGRTKIAIATAPRFLLCTSAGSSAGRHHLLPLTLCFLSCFAYIHFAGSLESRSEWNLQRWSAQGGSGGTSPICEVKLGINRQAEFHVPCFSPRIWWVFCLPVFIVVLCDNEIINWYNNESNIPICMGNMYIERSRA